MGAIPLGRAAYQRSDLAPLTLKNMFHEQAPTNLEEQAAILPRPRLQAFASVGAGPIRGLFRKGNLLANAGHNGRIICLSGGDLYRVHQTTGAATLIGAGIAGPGRMSAEGNEDVVVFTAGAQPYASDGDTVSEIAFPDDLQVGAVDLLNGYFLFASEFGRFYWSAPGGSAVDALDYATAESNPDLLQTLKVIGDELWLFGRLSIEVWQPTGDADLPFQRIGGRVFGIGLTARDTCQKFNVEGADTICWVGTDRKVYRNDPNPVRISDHAIEERLRGVADPATLHAATEVWDGHDFYVLTHPGAWSLAFDLKTGAWSERTCHGHPNYRANCSTLGPNNQPLLGDDAAGVIWELSDAERTDGTDPVVFEFSGLLEVAAGPARCHSVSLDVSVGATPDPQDDPMITLDWSDDLGETFADPVLEPLGRQGERRTKVTWTRLGMLRRPGRFFRWRTTEPVTVRKAKYNEALR